MFSNSPEERWPSKPARTPASRTTAAWALGGWVWDGLGCSETNHKTAADWARFLEVLFGLPVGSENIRLFFFGLFGPRIGLCFCLWRTFCFWRALCLWRTLSLCLTFGSRFFLYLTPVLIESGNMANQHVSSSGMLRRDGNAKRTRPSSLSPACPQHS